MNPDVLRSKVTDGVAVITLGSAKRIYFDAEMGDVLTEALEDFAGDSAVRVITITGGAPGYFNRHFDIPSLPLAQGLALERNLFLKLCASNAGLARMRSYEERKITSPNRSFKVQGGGDHG